jgi:hypothetical protein
VAIRSVAVPLLSGGALILGFAAFSWLRGRRSLLASSAPQTLREAGLRGPGSLEPERPAPAPNETGARFLARATDALSPFGGEFEPFDLDLLSLESGPLSEAAPRVAREDETLSPIAQEDEVTQSERRPNPLRARAR